MFGQPFYVAEDTAESRALVDRVCSSSRAENRAAAERLDAIGDLWVLRLRECGEREDWVMDAMEAVAAEVAAALGISQGLASSYLRYARAMRERLPQVAQVFIAGDLDYRMFQTVVYRTDLITDRDVLAKVDAELAVKAPRWPSMTPGRLAGQIDKIVAKADADAVRRRREAASDRDVWIGDRTDGLSEIHGSLFTADARALGHAPGLPGRDGLPQRSAHPRRAPRRRPRCARCRGRPAGVPLRDTGLLRRQGGGEPGGNPCDCRTGHHRRCRW